MRRAVKVGLLAVAVGGILLLFVFPARTLLSQDHALSVARKQGAVLAHENAALRHRASQLHSTAYIERIARQEYGLVMPGEKAFAVVPPQAPATTTTVPAGSAHGAR